MNYRKLSEEELKANLIKVKDEIKGLEETLDMMPMATALGRLSIKAFIKKKVKERNEILAELHSRSHD